jgi:hypothetical protein
MILYVVRRSKAWIATYQPETQMGRNTQKRWDSIFRFSFSEFRRSVNEIRVFNRQRIGFDVEYGIDDYPWFPEEGIILPTDDDDWFSPLLPEVLEAVTFSKAARWHYTAYWQDQWEVIEPPYPAGYWKFQTNNYALQMPCQQSWLGNEFAEHDLPGHDVYVDQALSVHNKHLASQTFWSLDKQRRSWQNASRSELLTIAETCYRTPECAEYVVEIELMKSLYKRLLASVCPILM